LEEIILNDLLYLDLIYENVLLHLSHQ